MKNFKTAVLLLTALAAVLTSCSSARETAVPYTVADSYFLKNDVTDYTPRKIESEEAFMSRFGIAMTMSTDRARLIDFSRQMALTVTLPETAVSTEISPISLKRKNGKLVLSYHVEKKGGPRSYTIVPCMVIAVNKKYNGDVEFKEM